MSGEPGVVVDRGLCGGGQVRGVVRGMNRRSGAGGDAVQGLAARGTSAQGAAAEDGAPSVAFIVPDFKPRAGGAEQQTRNQAGALARRGYRVTVLTRRQARGWPRREKLDGFEVVRLGVPGQGRTADKIMVVDAAAWLWRRRRTIDVINVVGYPDYSFSSVPAGLLRRTVVLWLGLGDATDILGPSRRRLRRLQRSMRRALLLRCEQVALTGPIASELADLGLATCVTIIPVPVDLSYYRPPELDERARSRRRLGIGDDELVVAYTGSLRALKGVDRLIDAFAALVEVHSNARLLIVGGERGASDDAGALWREQAEGSGLASKVTFTGRVTDVRSHLWAADIFVLPSAREGLSNSLLEAMACGLVCIAPVSAAGSEALSGGAGIVPPSNEVEHLVEAMLEVAENGPLRSFLGKTAMERVRSYDLDTVTDNYERLYRQLNRGIA
jgi:glycosyltransferase involved in cell wall biosynthesis